MFMMADDVREMIVKKSCKYGEYGSFEHLLFFSSLQLSSPPTYPHPSPSVPPPPSSSFQGLSKLDTRYINHKQTKKNKTVTPAQSSFHLIRLPYMSDSPCVILASQRYMCVTVNPQVPEALCVIRAVYCGFSMILLSTCLPLLCLLLLSSLFAVVGLVLFVLVLPPLLLFLLKDKVGYAELNKLVKKKRRTRARRKRKELIQETLEARKGPGQINNHRNKQMIMSTKKESGKKIHQTEKKF